MASHWDVTTSPFPPMTTYNVLTNSTHPHGDDIYLTPASLSILRDVPGIPLQYASANQDGRAVYVTGLPFSFTSEQVESVFNGIASVEKCPSLVALGTMHTFRWVIYEDAEGATSAIRLLNGEEVDGKVVRVVMSVSPNRVITVVKSDQDSIEEDEDEEAGEATPRVSQQMFHAHPTSGRGGSTPRRASATPRQVNSGPARPGTVVLMTPRARRQRAESGNSSAASPSIDSFTTTPLSAGVSSSAAPTHESKTSDPFITQASSWASIASHAQLSQNAVIDVQPRKRVRLNPIGRIPSVGGIRSLDANAEPLEEQKRVVLLLNLPKNIQLRDVSDAVREGSLLKIVFGTNDDDKTRYAGIIFQRAIDASRFYEILQKEREQSRPNRFRFIVDACMGDPFPMNDDIKAMDYPTYATRRLTIVKARFFFMFKEEHLKKLCSKVVPIDSIQLIWLYNGGNATVVFSDVGSAIKVKKELDRRASLTGQPGGESEIWSGLVTTFSKDPSLLPLDDLKSALHD